jgi:hypothetical protein
MPSFFGAAGAFGTAVYGRDPVAHVGDCPVPGGVAGIFFTEQEHDGWCNCVYGAVPELNTLCKIKIGQKLPDGATFLDPSMPWTVTGSRTRGLNNDALGKAMQAAMRKVMGLVENISIQPAGAGGPVSTGQPSPNSTQTYIDSLNVLRTGGGTMTVRPASTIPVNPPSSIDLSLATLSSLSPTTLAIGAFAVWYFLLRDPGKPAVSGFGFFGGRRRRRSRRIRAR